MDRTYLILKSVHILGVVLFLGNIIVTAWWKVMADRNGDPKVIAFAQRQVVLTDVVFTAGGVLLIVIGGVGNAVRSHMDLVHTEWLFWGRWLFTASGLIWLFVLIPVQVLQARIARRFEFKAPIPSLYWQLNRIWMTSGVIAILLPLANIYWMVFKPL
jgi:uncharacterized membrane protein